LKNKAVTTNVATQCIAVHSSEQSALTALDRRAQDCGVVEDQATGIGVPKKRRTSAHQHDSQGVGFLFN